MDGSFDHPFDVPAHTTNIIDGNRIKEIPGDGMFWFISPIICQWSFRDLANVNGTWSVTTTSTDDLDSSIQKNHVHCPRGPSEVFAGQVRFTVFDGK